MLPCKKLDILMYESFGGQTSLLFARKAESKCSPCSWQAYAHITIGISKTTIKILSSVHMSVVTSSTKVTSLHGWILLVHSLQHGSTRIPNA